MAKVTEIELVGTVDGLRGHHDHVLLISSLIINNDDGLCERMVRFAIPTPVAKLLRMDDNLTVRITVEREDE